MKKILIADANKASLVMTSEIFKDHYPGVQVCTAHTSEDTIRIATNQKNFDAFVIDFDLPDLNGANTALKIKKFSEKPVLITAFENQDVLDSLGAKFDQFVECKNFLKKPLHADVVGAICELYCKGNIKFQKPIFCQLGALACLIPASKAKKSSNTVRSTQICKSKLNINCAPIVIEECALNAVKFRFCCVEMSDPVIKSFTESEKNYMSVKGDILLKFQDPWQIESGQHMSWDEMKNIKNIKNMKKNSLIDRFQFELIGKIVEGSVSDNKQDNSKKNSTGSLHKEKSKSFWVEFEDILLSKKIFEALLREKMNEQFKMPVNGLY